MNSKNKLITITVLLIGLLMIFACTKDDDDAISPADVEKWTYFNISNGLPSNQINCLAEDSYHNLWIGTNKGLAKFDGNGFTNYSRKNGLPSDSIYSLIWTYDNGLIVGSHNGMGRLLKGEYYSDIEENGFQCKNLTASKDGKYIFCSTYDGYYIYDFVAYKLKYRQIDSTFWHGIYLSDAVYDIACINKDQFWVAAEKGVYIVTPTQTILHSNERLGLQLVTKMFNDKSGNIWLTSPYDEKVIYYNGSKFVNDTIFLDQNNYKAFAQDKYSNYWISIKGHGVLNYGGGMTRVYNTSNSKIVSNDINDILYDRKGNIWFGSKDNGLMYYQNIKPLQFNFDSGKNSETNANPIN